MAPEVAHGGRHVLPRAPAEVVAMALGVTVGAHGDRQHREAERAQGTRLVEQGRAGAAVAVDEHDRAALVLHFAEPRAQREPIGGPQAQGLEFGQRRLAHRARPLPREGERRLRPAADPRAEQHRRAAGARPRRDASRARGSEASTEVAACTVRRAGSRSHRRAASGAKSAASRRTTHRHRRRGRWIALDGASSPRGRKVMRWMILIKK